MDVFAIFVDNPTEVESLDPKFIFHTEETGKVHV
jgi:hypothetical protein